MKKIASLFTTLLFFNSLFAQSQPSTQPGCFPFPKTISVNGSAEMEVIPDEIYVQVDLREYKKKGEEKVDIEKIKNDFIGYCRSVGISESNISVASFDGYNMANIWRRRKKDPDLLASISYQVKFSNTKLIDDLVNMLDDQATNNFRITKATHSKIADYRKQLKIQAVKAAKEKALYLTEAVNEQLGQAVEISEPLESVSSDVLSSYYNNKSKMSNEVYYGDGKAGYSVTDAGVDFRKIKLRFEVKALYALK
ncbi:MAG: SIMPL domain-containing protein [Chitinophagaceae bacterium]|nr:SIMPL domain-containing protein [Chitinophagaceae bacterium]